MFVKCCCCCCCCCCCTYASERSGLDAACSERNLLSLIAAPSANVATCFIESNPPGCYGKSEKVSWWRLSVSSLVQLFSNGHFIFKSSAICKIYFQISKEKTVEKENHQNNLSTPCHRNEQIFSVAAGRSGELIHVFVFFIFLWLMRL
jgi:hypothetical protein